MRGPWRKGASVVLIVGSVAAGSLLNEPAAIAPVSGASQRDLERYAQRIQTTLTKPQDALIVNAHSRLVERCMRSRGFDVDLGTLSPDDIGLEEGLLTRTEIWTFDERRRAEQVGYGIKAATEAGVGEGSSTTATVPLESELGNRRWARYQRELYGGASERVEITELDGSATSIPGGGCLGHATRSVWLDVERYLQFRDARTTADSQLWLGTIEDPAVDAALRRWRSCMSRLGFDVDDPPAAYNAASRGGLDREREIATADVACKQQTRLVHAFVPAYVRGGEVVIQKLGPILTEFQEFEQVALRRVLSFRG